VAGGAAGFIYSIPRKIGLSFAREGGSPASAGLADGVRRITGGKGVDIVIESIGGTVTSEALSSLAATNVNLDRAMAAGRFREDLYYRIKVAVVSLPPLRERPGDIVPLAHHFLKIHRERLGLGTAAFAPEAMDLIKRYPWPGNVRELENVIHHALLVSLGPVVSAEDLHLPQLASETAETPTPSNVLAAALRSAVQKPCPNLYQTVIDMLVQSAYEQCDGNQVRTAQLLGVSRNVLRTHLARLPED